MIAVFEWVRKDLRDSALEQMENDLRVLRVVLIPRIEQRLTRSIRCDRRNEMYTMTRRRRKFAIGR